MRILFWSELSWPHIGGVEVLTQKLTLALRNQGHEIALITSHADLTLPDERMEDGIMVHRLPMQDLFGQGRLELFATVRQRLAKIKCEFRPQLTHVNFPAPSVALHWAGARARNGTTLLSVHHSLATLPNGPETLIGHSLQQAQHVVANSRYTLDTIVQACPAAAERCSLIYNGLDIPSHAPASLWQHPPRIACVGRMTYDKGFDVALAALAEARKAIPDLRLTLAGDGPEFNKLTALARTLDLEAAVTFTGWIAPAAVPYLFNSVASVLVPSRAPESFGLVALEAMQMGRPVIVAGSGALPEVIQHGETGIVVPSGDVAATASAMVYLFTHREQAERMGARGREYALAQFSLHRYVDEYEALYHQLVPGAK